MTQLKQVLVVRKDLNMRKGKMVAQGAHASLNAILRPEVSLSESDQEMVRNWMDQHHTKITVGVDSLSELLDVYDLAINKNLMRSLIQDLGLTEFKEPTFTAVAIGPGPAEDIDKITGHLKLL